ncbi:MFS transporter [Herbiconiux sp. 11R-BC]|uniref:MFS transporter n=1 Tax=Herbiconiux sp. 11R-BC TaxID=3111637 RepID=UPI003BFB7D2E
MSGTVRGTRRWWVLAVLSLTQLVVVLDGTIVSIALPQAQQELGLTDGQRQWVVTAYALVFGALLLLGGRVADYWGRKRTFLVGMVGFGVASVFGGLSQSGLELVIARGFQGLFAALLAPAALALLTITFASGRDRNTAFAVFGTIGGGGAAVGLVLGGVLTEFASWRWCLLVNVFFVVVGLIGGILLLTESKASGDNHYDVWGAVTVTLGLGSLVYGFSLAEEGWASLGTIGFLALGAALLVAFVWIETRVAQPLLPLRVVLDRVRGGAFLIQAIVGSVLIGATLYLTFHFQIVMGMEPLAAGLANVAMTVVILLVVPVVTRFLPVIGPRPFMIAGPLIAAGGMLYLGFITPDGSYWTQVLPALALLGIGLAMIFVPLQNLALTGVAAHDAGAASATVNSAMQIGGSIGLSVFTVVYVGALDGSLASGSPQLQALTDGYAAVFLAAAVALVVASLIAVFLIRGKKDELLPQPHDGAPAVAAHLG